MYLKLNIFFLNVNYSTLTIWIDNKNGMKTMTVTLVYLIIPHPFFNRLLHRKFERNATFGSTLYNARSFQNGKLYSSLESSQKSKHHVENIFKNIRNRKSYVQLNNFFLAGFLCRSVDEMANPYNMSDWSNSDKLIFLLNYYDL